MLYFNTGYGNPQNDISKATKRPATLYARDSTCRQVLGVLLLCFLVLAGCVQPKEVMSPTAGTAPTTGQAASSTISPQVTPSVNPLAGFQKKQTFTLSLMPLPSATTTPPAQARINQIRGKNQSLPLSCEARSAVDWAAYFGVPIDELEFQSRLPLSDDPDAGFVGNVMGVWGKVPPQDYGVHARPVAALLQEYGLPARDRRGMALDELKAEIAAGRPLIVWVVDHLTAGTPQAYTSHSGRQVTVAAYEHTVIATGYSPEVIYVLDGGWLYARAWQHFENSWAVLGNMAIVWDDGERR